jgi:hypothetical protein
VVLRRFNKFFLCSWIGVKVDSSFLVEFSILHYQFLFVHCTFPTLFAILTLEYAVSDKKIIIQKSARSFQCCAVDLAWVKWKLWSSTGTKRLSSILSTWSDFYCAPLWMPQCGDIVPYCTLLFIHISFYFDDGIWRKQVHCKAWGQGRYQKNGVWGESLAQAQFQ